MQQDGPGHRGIGQRAATAGGGSGATSGGAGKCAGPGGGGIYSVCMPISRSWALVALALAFVECG